MLIFCLIGFFEIQLIVLPSWPIQQEEVAFIKKLFLRLVILGVCFFFFVIYG